MGNIYPGFQYISDNKASDEGIAAQFPSIIKTFWNASAAAWVVGDFLMWDFATASVGTNFGHPTALKQATNDAAGASLIVGVALEAAAASGGKGKVLLSGRYEGANVADAVAQGDLLVGVGGAAGRVMKFDLTHVVNEGGADMETIIKYPVVGVALSDGSASNTGDVWLFNRWHF